MFMYFEGAVPVLCNYSIETSSFYSSKSCKVRRRRPVIILRRTTVKGYFSHVPSFTTEILQIPERCLPFSPSSPKF